MEQTIEVVPNGTGEPAGQRPTRRFAPIAEGALSKFRLRWLWILIAALLGGALSILLSAGPATYTSTATLQLNDSSGDSTRVKQIGQTVERTATSMVVINRAAKARDSDANNLAARTSALWQTDTDIVAITVSGSDPNAIVKDANAVVTSLTKFYNTQTQQQITELGNQGNALLSSGKLDDNQAETARKAGVGAAVATQQGDAAAGSTTVTRLDSANPAVATGLSLPVALVLGLFVGAVLSAALALQLPFRRRKVRRAAEVPVLLNGVRGVAQAENGAAEVAGLFLESERLDLAVVAMPGAEDSATSFGNDVMRLLRAHGVSTGLVEATDNPGMTSPRRDGSSIYSNLAAFHLLGQSGRSGARRELRASSLVLVATARAEALALLAGQGDVLAVVLSRSGRQRTTDLQSVLTQLRHSDPSVVLLP